MDFAFTDDQEQLQALARRVLADRVRLPSASGFDRALWEELGGLGLVGIGLPVELGGGGFGIVEQCLLLEEVGRALAPVPLLASTVMGAATIARFGGASAERWVRPAASGETVLTAALVEALDSPGTVARRVGDGWRLNGTKTCVPAGMVASAAVVPADAGVFVVDLDAAGVARTEQHTTNLETEAYLELADAPGTLLGGAEVLEWAVQRATVGACAMQLGVTEEALARTAAYTTERVQFERPIATFQAVGHRCADAYIDVEGIRLTLWQAAWRLSAELPAAMEVDVAKLWAAEGGHRVAHAAVHLHGGMGVATEHPIHRYFLAAKQLEFTLGNATEQRLRIGARLASQPA